MAHVLGELGGFLAVGFRSGRRCRREGGQGRPRLGAQGGLETLKAWGSLNRQSVAHGCNASSLQLHYLRRAVA